MKSVSITGKCALGGLVVCLLALTALGFYDTTAYYISNVECEIICATEWGTKNKNVPGEAYYFIAYASAVAWAIYLADYALCRRQGKLWWFLHPLLISAVFSILVFLVQLLLLSKLGLIDRTE